MRRWASGYISGASRAAFAKVRSAFSSAPVCSMTSAHVIRAVRALGSSARPRSSERRASSKCRARTAPGPRAAVDADLALQLDRAAQQEQRALEIVEIEERLGLQVVILGLDRLLECVLQELVGEIERVLVLLELLDQ